MGGALDQSHPCHVPGGRGGGGVQGCGARVKGCILKNYGGIE